MTNLVLVFKKIERENKTKSDNFYSNFEAEIIINKIDIDDPFLSIYTTIIWNLQKSSGKGSRLLIQSLTILLVFQIIVL